MPKPADSDWKDFVARESWKIMKERARKKGTSADRDPHIRDLDWLAIAIDELGGIEATAAKLGIARGTLYNWLRKGLGVAPFSKVLALHDLSGVSLGQLRLREGGPKRLPATLNRELGKAREG